MLAKGKIIILLLLSFSLTGCADNTGDKPSYQPAQGTEKPFVEIIESTDFDGDVITEEQGKNIINDNLSNDDTYINSEGEEIKSPTFAPSRPPGATAKCRDGTYSFSQSRRGTCSHHGGVATWY